MLLLCFLLQPYARASTFAYGISNHVTLHFLNSYLLKAIFIFSFFTISVLLIIFFWFIFLISHVFPEALYM
jgi:hypothetical protein